MFTLDLRYSDTDLNKGNCNAFTSAFNGTGTTNITSINPTGVRLQLVRRGGHRQAVG